MTKEWIFVGEFFFLHFFGFSNAAHPQLLENALRRGGIRLLRSAGFRPIKFAISWSRELSGGVGRPY